MTLKLELCIETIDKEGLLEPIQNAVRDFCKLKVGSIDFVAGGTIPKERRIILDERKWDQIQKRG